ncbi:MAG: tyrosinase family protein [Lewinella sp.]|jgi:hypothetical protein|uniref:tyrosinase family protein n=1 Tax=Lewinella sp. TaxID=2004506 RepID=UPI003D6C0A81
MRTNLLKKGAGLLAILLIAVTTFGQSQRLQVATKSEMYVRKNAASPEAKEDLEAMERAFKIMRSMTCEDSRAWYYQGAIHNIPKEIIGANKLCPRYETEKDKLFAWGDCTHTKTEASSLHFLLWHRMYTWHLEQIVRELSGKADFALPYWNYGSEVLSDNQLPAMFLDKKGSLYESARYSLLNNGNPIDDTTRMDIKEELDRLAITVGFAGKEGFSQQIEAAPHGLMHDYIGADGKETFFNPIFQKEMSGLMANVPSAGFDPAFWLHHSMIDRVWTLWDQSEYGERPTLKHIKVQPWEYNFIQPNGDEITYSLDEVYAIVFNPDYVYDDMQAPVFAAVPKEQMEVASRSMSVQDPPKEKVIWKQSVGEVITNQLVIAQSREQLRQNRSFIKSERSLTTSRSLLLKLDVSVYKEIGDYYKVYIHYPDGKKADQYIGMMTFFGVSHVHDLGELHSFEEEGAELSFTYRVPGNLLEEGELFEIKLIKRGQGAGNVTLESITLSAQE